jgi:hypothetical protein
MPIDTTHAPTPLPLDSTIEAIVSSKILGFFFSNWDSNLRSEWKPAYPSQLINKTT